MMGVGKNILWKKGNIPFEIKAVGKIINVKR